LVAEKNKNRETVKIPRRGGTGRNTRVLPSAADQSREYSDAKTPVGGVFATTLWKKNRGIIQMP